MKSFSKFSKWFIALSLLCHSSNLANAESPFVGSWAFELPDGNPAWLQIVEHESSVRGKLLWSVGSARPVKNLRIEDEKLHFERKLQWKPFGAADDLWILDGAFAGSIEDGSLVLTTTQYRNESADSKEALVIRGKKLPPMPARPDLSKISYGEAVELFNGTDLSGWKLSNPKKKNGWSVKDGVLVNETPKTDFGAYGDYGNLVTEATFSDFRLTIDYNVQAGGNSGVYLRGMYEAQVVDRDSKMQGIQGPGAVFGRIAPSENAGKPGGEWNRYVLTLVDRHLTVELNGKTVIDNQPIEGCTGGGLSADDTAPGPIFLQGDHTQVRYRNIRLERVLSTGEKE